MGNMDPRSCPTPSMHKELFRNSVMGIHFRKKKYVVPTHPEPFRKTPQSQDGRGNCLGPLDKHVKANFPCHYPFITIIFTDALTRANDRGVPHFFQETSQFPGVNNCILDSPEELPWAIYRNITRVSGS